MARRGTLCGCSLAVKHKLINEFKPTNNKSRYPRADGRVPTPEPEPEPVALEKKPLDEDWRYLDVHDLFSVSIKLRQVRKPLYNTAHALHGN